MLSAVPGVTGYAVVTPASSPSTDQIVPAIGVDPPPGSTGQGDDGGYLTMLAGRPPDAPDEIALGAQTLRAIHARLGETVRVAVNLATGIRRARAPSGRCGVVGVAVFPDFGLQDLSDTDLGNGAVVPAALLTTTQANTRLRHSGVTCYDFFLLRYRPGTDTAAAAHPAARRRSERPAARSAACTVTTDQRPGDIKDYAAVSDTPLALGLVLAVLAVATVAHVLFTGVRRRRRDMAVLKTLGFTRRQVLGAVAWEATALAAAALLIGIPVGVVAGRWPGRCSPTRPGSPARPPSRCRWCCSRSRSPSLLANVVAAWPGWAAARLRPARGACEPE